jgi:hypothetical protein
VGLETNSEFPTHFSTRPYQTFQDGKSLSPNKTRETPSGKSIDFNQKVSFKEKDSRTRLIKFQPTLFEDIIKTSVDLNVFKLSCLKNKSNLYENPLIQIGFLSGLIEHEGNIYLQISLFIGNKTQSPINEFSIKYVGNSGELYWIN